MERYFWREKNALKFKDILRVWDPSKEELECELSLKLLQKLEKIDIIFDKQKRLEFVASSRKKIQSFEGLNEGEIEKKIGLGVIVDFFQLINDISNFYNIDFIVANSSLIENDIGTIKHKIGDAIDRIKKKDRILSNLQKIYEMVCCLANILNLSSRDIEKEMQRKELKEGSFLKGKYVLW